MKRRAACIRFVLENQSDQNSYFLGTLKKLFLLAQVVLASPPPQP
jgi:hypothetical protein